MVAESKTPWTPGPWKAVQNGLGFIGVRTADEDWITYSAGPDRFGRATQEANARLVSKAPELVELLDEVTALAELLANRTGNAGGYEITHQARALLQQIRGDK